MSAPGCPPAPPVCHVSCCAAPFELSLPSLLSSPWLTGKCADQAGLGAQAVQGPELHFGQRFDGRRVCVAPRSRLFCTNRAGSVLAGLWAQSISRGRSFSPAVLRSLQLVRMLWAGLVSYGTMRSRAVRCCCARVLVYASTSALGIVCRVVNEFQRIRTWLCCCRVSRHDYMAFLRS